LKVVPFKSLGTAGIRIP